MASMGKHWNVTIIGLMALAAGCRTGIPTDRDVHISQHLGSHQSPDRPPRTRLASTGMTAADNANGAGPAEETAAGGSFHRLSDSALDASVPDQAPAPEKSLAPAKDSSPEKTAAAKPAAEEKAAEVDVDALVAAIRGGDPKLQQEAIAQLLAAVGEQAKRTAQPGDISEQLAGSLAALPVLQEAEDAPSMPTRLATKPAETGSGAISLADGAADTGSRVAPASSQSAGDRAVAASAILTDPVPAADIIPLAAPPQELARSLGEDALFAELITRLQQPAAGASDGERFRREVILRHLQVLAGDVEAAMQSLAELPATEQAFLHDQLAALASMTDPGGHPVTSRRFAAALPPMRSAVQHLARATEQLDVQSLAFCTEILSFGQVKPFADNRFEAGQKVILYCEVDNFVAEKIAEGYETELQGSYEIFDAQGTKVAGQVLPADRQVSNRELRDYFIAYQMHLPSQLQPGEYRLELSMECVKGRKYGQGTLPLVIAE